jgi:alpha-ribazole phosphatase/probable phosphoglycerate mutase
VSVALVFETHSTTEDNETGIMTGWLPGRLSATGREQAAELGERRRDVLLDWRLRECDYGELNGTARTGRGIDDPFPGGETWRRAVARVHRFLDELVATRDGQRVLVIWHMATRYGVVSYATGRPLEDVLAEEFVWQPGWEHVL